MYLINFCLFVFLEYLCLIMSSGIAEITINSLTK